MRKQGSLRQGDLERIERGREYSRLLRRSLNRLRAIGAELVEPYGITSHQYLALLWIRDHEGLTQGNLAAELDSDANTISAILRHLDKKKLIERRRHPNDGRAITLYATTTGKRLVSAIRPKFDQVSLSLLSLLPPGHEAQIAAWLKRVASIGLTP